MGLTDCRKLHRACILALSWFPWQSLQIAASSTELASWRYPGLLHRFITDAVACHGTTNISL
ncbi:MAG: hypothetical protein ACI31F_07425 [Muribaculaceae bacterium]